MGEADTAGRRPSSSRLRVMVAFGVGGLAGLVMAALGRDVLALLLGWDVAVIIYISWTWVSTWKLGAEDTAKMAVREDPGRAVADALLLVAAVASLAAVGAVIATAGHRTGIEKPLATGFGVGSIVLSWALVHTVFTARYARLYYSGADGGINFHEDHAPRYSDFAYVAFTVGMTFQVSDTDVTSKAMRVAVLGHSLLSYMLGAVIIAAAINLVAGLVR